MWLKLIPKNARTRDSLLTTIKDQDRTSSTLDLKLRRDIFQDKPFVGGKIKEENEVAPDTAHFLAARLLPYFTHNSRSHITQNHT